MAKRMCKDDVNANHAIDELTALLSEVSIKNATLCHVTSLPLDETERVVYVTRCYFVTLNSNEDATKRLAVNFFEKKDEEYVVEQTICLQDSQFSIKDLPYFSHTFEEKPTLAAINAIGNVSVWNVVTGEKVYFTKMCYVANDQKYILNERTAFLLMPRHIIAMNANSDSANTVIIELDKDNKEISTDTFTQALSTPQALAPVKSRKDVYAPHYPSQLMHPLRTHCSKNIHYSFPTNTPSQKKRNYSLFCLNERTVPKKNIFFFPNERTVSKKKRTDFFFFLSNFFLLQDCARYQLRVVLPRSSNPCWISCIYPQRIMAARSPHATSRVSLQYRFSSMFPRNGLHGGDGKKSCVQIPLRTDARHGGSTKGVARRP